ncbi:putative rgs domain protein [Phaeomoniella chlamydospora]|uniref:Putative rgs domain protein n=1 Tax=Phaeomoniella chlamydospora TaxID=158046 RepID=A0A0G2EKC1_PHACM|nr:putative rgs domain protein [Phaeomoniella chlamydospora]
MLVETPELEKAGSKRSSQILDNYEANVEGRESGEKSIKESSVSAFMREQKNGHSPHGSLGSQAAKHSPSERPPRPSFMTNSDPRTDSNSPGQTVARDDIRASAEKILYTFLLPGSEREIVLPQHMLESIRYNIEEEGRDDPEVFDNAKEYVFQAMERDAYPGFLQAKALGNLVPLSVLLRLVLGLASMMAGFWGGFYMILTDTPRRTRCWVILPFTLGAYFLMTYQYKLDPIMAFLGFSEYTFMNWSRIREPYVGSLLRKRATMTIIMALVIATALCVLFIFVPGTKF